MTPWMLVEDEPDVYDMLLAMFELLGHDGISFTTGEDAVAWVDEVDRGLYPYGEPEVALIDIRLPGTVSGPMVGEHLRVSQRLSNLPIILITAYHLTPEDESAVIAQADADLLLYKPLPALPILNDYITQVIANRAR